MYRQFEELTPACEFLGGTPSGKLLYFNDFIFFIAQLT